MNNYQFADVPTLGILIPCYNEEDVIPITTRKLIDVLNELKSDGLIAANSFLGVVDDGSNDQTWPYLVKTSEEEPNLKAISLSTNFGHQNALLCGLIEFGNLTDCIVSLDADLQDDIGIIKSMLIAYSEGFDIIYGVRKKRDLDSFFKQKTASLFYRFANMLGIRTIPDHADFRLVSKRVLDVLKEFRETNLFLRGIFPSLGFNSKTITYNRDKRAAGDTKYSIWKMISFAIDGITSFSVAPLRLITVLGICVFIFSLMLSAYAIYSYIFLEVEKGWSSIVLPMYFLGGIQLLAIGIIGEYLGKIYKEVKQRPRYIIKEKIS
ncbi:MAG: glycosyltransferase family 2 protein [Cyclobacteriaceae bacterium]